MCAVRGVYCGNTNCKTTVEGLTSLLGFEGGYVVASRGRSGGIGIFWKDGINLTVKNCSKYHVDAWVKEPWKDEWWMTFFYGEGNRMLKRNTWDTMTFLRGESTLPWSC